MRRFVKGVRSVISGGLALYNFVIKPPDSRLLAGKISNLNKNLKHVRVTLKNNSGKATVYLSLKDELSGTCLSLI